MAGEQECLDALHRLAARMAAKDNPTTGFTRTLSCTVRDLGITFGGRLHDGRLDDIRHVSGANAQIRLELSSTDLLALVDGGLNLGSAWATGRVKVHAGVRDLMKLRSMF